MRGWRRSVHPLTALTFNRNAVRAFLSERPELIAAAVDAGCSWAVIAATLGVTVDEARVLHLDRFVLDEPVVPLPPAASTMVGASVVLTGALKTLSRASAVQAVVERGGRCTAGLTRGTTVVVAGQGASARKLEVAEERGVSVLDEMAFREMLAGARLAR